MSAVHLLFLFLLASICCFSRAGVVVWEGGTNSPLTGATHTFSGLNPGMYTYKLAVDVYETDFASTSEYVDEISAGGVVLSSYCNPGKDGGSEFYACVSNATVTNNITSGGTLDIVTTATSSVNCCGYNSYNLYVRYTLFFTARTTTSLEWKGGTNSPTDGAAITFVGLDPMLFKYDLSVLVYETDFASTYEYVDGIYAGSTSLSTFCNPGVDSGTSYYACVTNQSVTGDVTGGALTVLTTATSDINCCSYNGYYLYVHYILTATARDGFYWEGGTNVATTGVSHTFTGLDTSMHMYFLTVEVFETDFASTTEYVDGIYAGAATLSTSCDPGIDAGSSYHTCIDNQTVTGNVSSGGSLTVLTTATSSVNCCPYNGYVLYVKYRLFEVPLTTSSLVWERGTNDPVEGVFVTFIGLDTSLYQYKLTVLVYETDFYDSTEYVDGIYAGQSTISSFCNPGVDSGGSFYNCVDNHTVTSDISSTGTLTVRTTATSDINCCSYNGYNFYVKYILTRTALPVLTWSGGTISPTLGVSYTFEELDTSQYDYVLSVLVYETDFASDNEYVDGIYAGSTSLSTFCNPGVDSGTSYYACVTNQSVTGDVTGGALTVLTTATSEINCCSYNGYYLYVEYTLTRSIRPILHWEGGTNVATSGVSHTFTGLDTTKYLYFLTVEVFETDFGSTTEYVDGIYAGAATLSTSCDPGIDAGSSYHMCIDNQTVTGDVSSNGTLTILTTATSSVNCCPYNGFYLYVKYALARSLLVTTTSLVWEGGTNMPVDGVIMAFVGLDTSLYNYNLTVQVWQTDFYDSTEYVDGIYAGSSRLSSFCNPGEDSGGSYYTCIHNQTVTSNVSSNGMLTLRTTATNYVNCCAYNGYYLYVRYMLSRTLISSTSSTLSWEGGTNSPISGVSHTFTGLNTNQFNYRLTVEVYETDFASSNEYVDGIHAGSTILLTDCNPGVDVGGSFYTCLADQDVTGDVTSGSSLTVSTTATSDVNCCPYNGYILYVKYTLEKVQATTIVWHNGTNSPTSGVVHSFTGLNTALYSYILTVEVYQTDFASYNEYVDGVYAGYTTLSSNCNPGADSGGSYYTCTSNDDVTSDITSAGELVVRVTATSSVDCCAYNGFFLYTRYTLRAVDVVFVDGNVDTWRGGTNAVRSGAAHTFLGLDTSQHRYALSVEVYETDFASTNEYVDSIVAGTKTLSSLCDPGVDSGSSYYTCLSDVDVTDEVSSTGALVVNTTATDAVNCCSYLGHTLHVAYTLTTKSASGSVQTWEGGTNAVTTGVKHTFTGMDTSLYTYTVRVEVYATDFLDSDEYVNGIYAGSNLLLSYCNPGADSGGFFYECLEAEDISGDISSSGSLEIKVTSTGQVNCCAYKSNYLYVRITMNRHAPKVTSWEGGTNYPTSGVYHVFYGLDTVANKYYLTAEVYANDYDLSSEYVSEIFAGDTLIVQNCDPDIDSHFFYACVRGRDVTKEIKESTFQNQLEVSSHATTSVNEHPYNGHNFYVRYSLQTVASSHTSAEENGGSSDSNVSLIIGLVVMVGGCCCVCAIISAIAFMCSRKGKDRRKRNNNDDDDDDNVTTITTTTANGGSIRRVVRSNYARNQSNQSRPRNQSIQSNQSRPSPANTTEPEDIEVELEDVQPPASVPPSVLGGDVSYSYVTPDDGSVGAYSVSGNSRAPNYSSVPSKEGVLPSSHEERLGPPPAIRSSERVNTAEAYVVSDSSSVATCTVAYPQPPAYHHIDEDEMTQFSLASAPLPPPSYEESI